jgi:hypothetical protein
MSVHPKKGMIETSCLVLVDVLLSHVNPGNVLWTHGTRLAHTELFIQMKLTTTLLSVSKVRHHRLGQNLELNNEIWPGADQRSLPEKSSQESGPNVINH